VNGETGHYKIDRFIQTEKTVMGRRNQEMSEAYEQQLRSLHEKTKELHKGEELNERTHG